MFENECKRFNKNERCRSYIYIFIYTRITGVSHHSRLLCVLLMTLTSVRMQIILDDCQKLQSDLDL